MVSAPLLFAPGQIVRYRDENGSSTSPGLVLKIASGAVLVERNFRFITPVRKWIAVDDVVEVLHEISPL